MPYPFPNTRRSRAEGLLGDVLAAGARACAAPAADPVVALAFAAVALGLAAEEACQAALGAPAAAALLCRLLQARAPPPSALARAVLPARGQQGVLLAASWAARL
jgi:hypothetical protein